MSEKSIVSKVPPVDREAPNGGFLTEQPTTAATTSKPAETAPAGRRTRWDKMTTEEKKYVLVEKTETSPLVVTDNRRFGLVGVEDKQTETIQKPQITITPAQEIGYITFLVGMVCFGLLAVILFSRISKVIEQKKKAVTVGAVFFLVIAAAFTVCQIMFSQALNNQEAFLSWLRPAFWIAATPLACLLFPALVGSGPKAKPFFLVVGGAACGAFLLLTIGELVSITAVQYITAVLALGLGAFTSFLLYQGVEFLPEDTRPPVVKLVKLFSKCLPVIWIIYPIGLILTASGIPEATKQIIYSLSELTLLLPIGFSLMTPR